MLQTINFQGVRLINALATFFRYESASVDSIDQSIKVRADGNDLGVFYPGDSVDLPVQARTWEITPMADSGAGVVRLGLGRVETARLAGVVSISNRIGAGVAALTGNTAPPVGFTALQVIAPAANPRGLVVRRAALTVNGAAGGTVAARLTSAPVVPASSIPANSYQVAGASQSGAGQASATKEDLNFILPAGWGVWWLLDASAVAPGVCFYEFWSEAL